MDGSDCCDLVGAWAIGEDVVTGRTGVSYGSVWSGLSTVVWISNGSANVVRAT